MSNSHTAVRGAADGYAATKACERNVNRNARFEAGLAPGHRPSRAHQRPFAAAGLSARDTRPSTALVGTHTTPAHLLSPPRFADVSAVSQTRSRRLTPRLRPATCHTRYLVETSATKDELAASSLALEKRDEALRSCRVYDT